MEGRWSRVPKRTEGQIVTNRRPGAPGIAASRGHHVGHIVNHGRRGRSRFGRCSSGRPRARRFLRGKSTASAKSCFSRSKAGRRGSRACCRVDVAMLVAPARRGTLIAVERRIAMIRRAWPLRTAERSSWYTTSRTVQAVLDALGALVPSGDLGRLSRGGGHRADHVDGSRTARDLNHGHR